MKVTAINYGQFLLNSHRNFTGTYFADTVPDLEHDSVYRYLKNDRLTSRLVWEKTKPLIKRTPKGILIFDNTVLDKNASRKIGPARSQYSGNAHHVVTGIEKCQARINRSQRNHICLVTLAWIVLTQAAQGAGKTIYQQKLEPLQQFVADQWRNPTTTFVL